MNLHLTQPLHKALIERPRSTALVCGARRPSFAEFVDRVARLASVLRSLGVEPGDRVGILALNSDRYVEYLYAVWWAGGVINPVNIRWSAQEVVYSLDHCGTRVLLVDSHHQATAAALRGLSTSLHTLVYFDEGPAPDGMHDAEWLIGQTEPVIDVKRGGDALAAVMYTGGTTGRPKGVMLTHGNLVVGQLSVNAAVERPVDAVGINTAPMFHIGGLALVLQLMQRLCKQVVVPTFSEVTLLKVIEEERGSETFLVQTMLKRIIEHPRFAQHDLSSLQLVLYGAAPIDDALLTQAQKVLPNASFCQLYGMTELSPVITVLPAWSHAPDQPSHRRRSVGRAVPVAEVRIVDMEGDPVPPGTVGEIVARGPMVMAGYWNDPEQTAQALRDGWMHTGDGGRMDLDGFIYVVDRIKDMIVTGGENVYSAEVENVIAQLPAVAMCAVIGVPDERWGERVHAVVVLRAGCTLEAQAVIDHCKGQIAGFKCPRGVEFRDALPLSPAGKLLKYQVRKPYWAGRDREVS